VESTTHLHVAVVRGANSDVRFPADESMLSLTSSRLAQESLEKMGIVGKRRSEVGNGEPVRGRAL